MAANQQLCGHLLCRSPEVTHDRPWGIGLDASCIDLDQIRSPDLPRSPDHRNQPTVEGPTPKWTRQTLENRPHPGALESSLALQVLFVASFGEERMEKADFRVRCEVCHRPIEARYTVRDAEVWQFEARAI